MVIRQVIAMVVFVSVAAAMSAQAVPDFAGRWTIDSDRTAALSPPRSGSAAGSTGGGGGGIAAVGSGGSGPAEWVITQTSAALTIVRALPNGTEQKYVYKLDGSESVNVNGRTTQKSRTTVSNGRLVTAGTQTVTTDQGELSSEFKEARWLDKDASMIVETTRTANGTSRVVTQAFRKSKT